MKSHKEPVVTNMTGMHIDGHADEAFGRWAARKYGESSLPGISKARDVFFLDGPYLTQEEYDRRGLTCFGCGGGRFDEHRATGRLPDSSCAKLVLDDLEITDRAALILGNEIHWCDNNAGASSTQISELIKSFHRHLPAKTRKMLEWADQAFDAIHNQLSLPFAGEGQELGIVNYLEGLLSAGWYKGKESSLPYIRELLNRSIENTKRMTTDRTYYTELDYIVRAMQRAGIEHKTVYTWAQNALSCLISDQELFSPAVDLVKDRRNQGLARAQDVPHGTIRFCVLHTDNPMALRAANYARQQVTILRNKIGQVQIFLDRKTGLNLDRVMGMIRWMETPVAERQSLNWQEICTTPGSMPCAPHWHYNRERGQIYNGSTTHPGVLPSPLATKAFVEIINHAFLPSLTGDWMREHGVIKKSAKRPTRRHANQASASESKPLDAVPTIIAAETTATKLVPACEQTLPSSDDTVSSNEVATTMTA